MRGAPVNHELPLPLAEFIAAGGDPRAVLGDRFEVLLLDELIRSMHLTDDERARQAARHLWHADQLAANVHDGSPFQPRDDDDRAEQLAASRWVHDLMADERARSALLGILDPLDAAGVEVVADQMLRPAPLAAHTSTGQRCESCGAYVEPGERMLTFELRYEPTTGQPMDDLRTEEALMATAWKWCAGCVLDRLHP
jgi:hypothetical protein